MVASSIEHLRYYERGTAPDREVQRVTLAHPTPPVVTHLLHGRIPDFN